MSDRDDLHRHGPAVVAMSLERRRVCRWLLLPAAQLVVPSVASASVRPRPRCSPNERLRDSGDWHVATRSPIPASPRKVSGGRRR